MRISLIIFGVIFLVIGALLYVVPTQTFNASTNTAGGGETDVRTSSATVNISVGYSYASAIIGFVLLVLGLVIPGTVKVIQGPRGPRGSRGSKTVLSVQGPRGPRGRRGRGTVLSKGTSVTTTTRIKK